jgi:hypothetical protein
MNAMSIRRVSFETNKLKYIKNIQKKFNIYEKKNNESLNIKLENITSSSFSIIIKHTFMFNKFYFDNLPSEINNLINTFIDYYLEIKLDINMPDRYPFASTELSMRFIEIKNIDKKIVSYYKDKTATFYCEIKKIWSPAIRLETLVLMLFTTIDFYKLHDIINMNIGII